MDGIQSIRSTYKGNDTEEFLDKIFYRPFGYAMALISKALGISPNAVTIISIFIGAAAGHLFYYESVTINIYGMLLLMLAEAMDSTDGQLARITNSKSRIGRILDGFGGNLWFLSIYLHLFFRMINEGYSPYIFLLILFAGISHSFQSGYADYFRNYYLLFVYGRNKSEIDESSELRDEYRKLSWSKNSPRKFLMRIYLNYTIQQELFSKKVIKLYRLSENVFNNNVPPELSKNYKRLNKPLVKYFNILTTNTRMIFLFIVLFINLPVLYFLFEVSLMNFLLVYVIIKHEKNSMILFNLAAGLKSNP